MEAASEARQGDGATPGLADEEGTEEAGWVVRWEAGKDLLDELVRERRRQRRCQTSRYMWIAMGWDGQTPQTPNKTKCIVAGGDIEVAGLSTMSE